MLAFRAGIAPARVQRLFTAHCLNSCGRGDFRYALRAENQHRITFMRGVHLQFVPTRASRAAAAPWLLSIFSIVVLAGRVGAQEPKVPSLGSPVPKQVITARTRGQRCLTDVNHHDPCASVRIGGVLFTVAWDERTKVVTYLFTTDHRIVTDSELGVGGGCRLVDETGEPDVVVQYIGWLVTPAWTDTIRDLSGDAIWYAALSRDEPPSENGTVVAFVQSRYLRLP